MKQNKPVTPPPAKRLRVEPEAVPKPTASYIAAEVPKPAAGCCWKLKESQGWRWLEEQRIGEDDPDTEQLVEGPWIGLTNTETDTEGETEPPSPLPAVVEGAPPPVPTIHEDEQYLEGPYLEGPEEDYVTDMPFPSAKCFDLMLACHEQCWGLTTYGGKGIIDRKAVPYRRAAKRVATLEHTIKKEIDTTIQPKEKKARLRSLLSRAYELDAVARGLSKHQYQSNFFAITH